MISEDGIRIGMENEDGTVADLSRAFPDCPRGLVDALSKHGSHGVMDRTRAW